MEEYDAQAETAEVPEAPMAPDFVVYDAQGEEVRLSDYFGKPIVLNFWASWCGPCQMEMPHFEQAYLDLGEDVQFLMVNMTGGRETRKSGQDFLDEMGYTFPVLFDLDMDALYNYQVYSLPMTVFIDGAGNVQDMAIGAIDEATLLSKIALIYTE
jgi:thiol-disulfide isomerase/thioredoxin